MPQFELQMHNNTREEKKNTNKSQNKWFYYPFGQPITLVRL